MGRLDVLRLADSCFGEQAKGYAELRYGDAEGWQETRLPWRENYPSLPSKEVGLRRLENLVRELRSQGIINRYHRVIQDAGIVKSLWS